MRRQLFPVLLLVLPLALAAPQNLQAQGSMTELTSGSDLQRNLSPQQRAAEALSRAERALATAQRKEAALADAPEAKRAKLTKKVEAAYERADREASEALEQDPSQARIHCVRGVARLALGRFGEAKADCHQAISMDESDAEGLLCYGRASLATEDPEQAMAAYDRLRAMPEQEALAQRLAEALQSWSNDASPDHPSVARIQELVSP